MFESIISMVGSSEGTNDPVDWAVPVESVARRSYRLFYVDADAQATSRMIGCHEFQLFDAQGRNLCRTAGFIPKLGWSRALTQGAWWDPVTHGPAKTIDGDISNWASTCYGGTSKDLKAFIQYTFLDDFIPTRWTFKCEGAYIPANTSMKSVQLQRLNSSNLWVDCTGVPTPAGLWPVNGTKSFAMPQIVD